MLTSILPGLRDLRTPLAAGYVWLAGLWVCVVNILPSRQDATGFIAHVYAASSFLGPGSTIAITTFFAFLIGSLTTLSPAFLSLGNGLISQAAFSDLDLYYSDLTARLRRVGAAMNDDEIEKVVARPQKVRTGVQALLPWLYARRYSGSESAAYSSAVESELRWSRLSAEDKESMEDYSFGPRRDSIATSVLNELPQLVPRLHADSKDLFDDYDRLHAEAEFRLTLIPPLTFVIISTSVQWSHWCLFLLALIPILGLYSAAKERAANTVVIQALCIEKIRSGLASRIESAIESATRRAADGLSTPTPV